MKKVRILTKARYLRNEQTKAEKMLWEKIRKEKLGIKFRRQHSIDNFILDFYAPKIKLGIELDGGFHKENKGYDKNRMEYLKSRKIKVLRFWNSEVENGLEKVLEKINKEING